MLNHVKTFFLHFFDKPSIWYQKLKANQKSRMVDLFLHIDVYVTAPPVFPEYFHTVDTCCSDVILTYHNAYFRNQHKR